MPELESKPLKLEGATGSRADERVRLRRLGDQLRHRLAESGRFSLVDITPVASEARETNLHACGGCDISLAKRVGAQLAISGTVQKVSNLILNMNIYIRDVSSGETIAAMSADMRGNTDESWSRTLDWLIRALGFAPGSFAPLKLAFNGRAHEVGSILVLLKHVGDAPERSLGEPSDHILIPALLSAHASWRT
jgi:hypothetical protein